MMKKNYFGLLGFFAIWIVSAQAQAATTSLNSYLVLSAATSPIEVSFSYMPPYQAADYPRLRQATGKLYAKFFHSWDTSLSLIAYDNAYVGSDGDEYAGAFFFPSSGMFSPVPSLLISGYECHIPLIPTRGVTGISFPIILLPETTYNCLLFGGQLPPTTAPSFVASYTAPSIVTVADGNQIESVKVSVSANGESWADYIFGYRIGLIQIAAAPATATLFQVPTLIALTLPPPAIEGSVVEYNNTVDFPASPGGHFFYSSDAAEQQAIDSGQVGHFYRTGRSFNAGGYVPVCRFYGSQTPGPNSHFFSADQNECAGLKALQKSPVPSDVQQWNSEGNGFYAVAAVTDASGKRSCLTGTVQVYRAYNNAYAKDGKRNAWDSNHRFSTNRADIDLLVNNWGWSDEGIVFCAPG